MDIRPSGFFLLDTQGPIIPTKLISESGNWGKKKPRLGVIFNRLYEIVGRVYGLLHKGKKITYGCK